MDWITGIQRALDYIEDNITEEIDPEVLGRISYSSSYHFQRVFGILCGYSLGEYIRNRRLTLAGADLASSNEKVIEIAMKYGYESPDSFTKAFTKFHGITPSAAREPGATLRSFSPLSIKLSLEGGHSMKYRIEEKPAFMLLGYKRRFNGTPGTPGRSDQEHEFKCETRLNEFILQGMAHDCDTTYMVMKDFDPDGYNFYFASLVENWEEYLKEELGDEAQRFEEIHIPTQLYVICESEKTKYPTNLTEDLRQRIVSQWLPSSGYRLADAPEIAVLHWPYEKGNEKVNNSRYVEIWLPIEKAKS